jgi:hypothetical protein
VSTSRSTIPQHAATLETVQGRVIASVNPDTPRASVQLLQARTGHAGTLTQWVLVKVEGQRFGWADRPYYCERFSGRRLALVPKIMAEFRAMIAA